MEVHLAIGRHHGQNVPQKKRKFQDSDRSTIKIAQAHDVHAIEAMAIETFHGKYQKPAKVSSICLGENN